MMLSTQSPRKIGVFYLLRNGNNNRYVNAFIKSLSLYNTSLKYELTIVAKGFGSETRTPVVEAYTRKYGVDLRYIYVNDDGFDLTAYHKAALKADVDYCLFLNSYSRMLDEHWLEKYWNALSSLGGNSMVGATGSYASYGEDAPFPSIHIRTNAFFIRRDLFLALDAPLQTKLDCHLYESGNDSISKRISANGGQLAIVDRKGQIIAPDRWPDAGVFCSGRQENLLVADNRTHDYALSKQRRRWRLSRAAWGKERANALGDLWLARQLSDIRWKLGSVVP
jgi:hypothetical protein